MFSIRIALFIKSFPNIYLSHTLVYQPTRYCLELVTSKIQKSFNACPLVSIPPITATNIFFINKELEMSVAVCPVLANGQYAE